MERRARQIARFDPREYRSTGRAPTRNNNNNNNNNSLFAARDAQAQNKRQFDISLNRCTGRAAVSLDIAQQARESACHRKLDGLANYWTEEGRHFPNFPRRLSANRRADSPDENWMIRTRISAIFVYDPKGEHATRIWIMRAILPSD